MYALFPNVFIFESPEQTSWARTGNIKRALSTLLDVVFFNFFFFARSVFFLFSLSATGQANEKLAYS